MKLSQITPKCNKIKRTKNEKYQGQTAAGDIREIMVLIVEADIEAELVEDAVVAVSLREAGEYVVLGWCERVRMTMIARYNINNILVKYR